MPRTKGGGVATALPEEPAGWKRKQTRKKAEECKGVKQNHRS